MQLPVDAVLPQLMAALAAGPCAVLSAPPGAGKTTRVPLALLDAPWLHGKILMLEPRRIAARAAAERLAAQLAEPVGRTVGYRIRGEGRPGARIEVVTEGILTRMLQSAPDLPGIGAVLFDEVHERSIHSDLGLALSLEVQEALRPELRLLAMSATLDTRGFARLMGGAPVIESAGRLHPVRTHWLDRPWRRPGATRAEMRRAHLDTTVALVLRALAETATGDILVFLPGAGEIGRAAARLRAEAPDAEIAELHGSLPFAQQRAVLARGEADDGPRRIVLATAIAETSLTVPGVRIVVDAGLSRRSRTDPGTGLARLVTVSVSRAEADQRRGRAGRLGPGTCYRLWTKGEEGGLPPFAPPEIAETDLSPLAIELALWGAAPAELRWLDPPPQAAFAAAQSLLADLGALDAQGQITAHGRAIAAQPLHPRLAHMLLVGRAQGQGAQAALLAALLAERDPLRGHGADLRARVRAVSARRPDPAADPAVLARIRAEAARISVGRGSTPPDDTPVAAGRDSAPPPSTARSHPRADPASADMTPADTLAGPLAALAYPDRIALRRPGGAPRYLLSGGRGAMLDAADPLAGERLLVATDLEDATEARIRLAAPIAEAELRAALGERIAWVETVEWSPRTARVEARRREMLGAIALSDAPWGDAPPDRLGAALADGVRALGIARLDWPEAARSLRARVMWLRRQAAVQANAAGAESGGPGEEQGRSGRQAGQDTAQPGLLADRLPDWSDDALLATLDDWLTPHLAGLRRIEQIDLSAALRAALDWETLREIDRRAPPRLETPLGSASIDYARDRPTVAIRVQELFGTTSHPMVGDPPVPLSIELLSPAMRPVQTTGDLPGFWASSYADVRRDMRARYPKHPWPEDPAAAQPTRRAKLRE